MQGNFMFLLFIIIPIGIIFWMMSKRKKAKMKGPEDMNAPEKKDEVWRTIKQFVANQGEVGKEVMSSFVAKRQNPLLNHKTKKVFEAEVKAHIDKEKLDAVAAKAYRREQVKEAGRELYCIWFVTRDAKTKVRDEPRIFEAEVVQKRTAGKRGETARTIVINGLQDFDKEYAWIGPIKKREEAKMAAARKKKEARMAKKAARKQARTSGRKQAHRPEPKTIQPVVN